MKTEQISIHDLVTGDVVVLENGDHIRVQRVRENWPVGTILDRDWNEFEVPSDSLLTIKNRK